MDKLDSAPPAETTRTSAAGAGKAYRLGRIFAEDGRSVVVPADHGTQLGRLAGLEDPLALLRRFLPLGCDGFLLGPGLTQRSADLFTGRGAPARLMTVDTYYRDAEGGTSVLITSLERAAQLGVDAVKVFMPWDVAPDERARCSAFVADVIVRAEPLGLPVMVEPIAIYRPRGPEAVAAEGDGCRMAAELGADIIKVAYPDDPELLGAWVLELGVPLVILGGPPSGTADDLCALVADAMAAGAAGITIGRRLWQRPPDEAAELLGRLQEIVHPGGTRR